MRYTHGGNIYKVNRERGIELSEIIDFSANINPLGIAQSAKDAMLAAFSELENYPDPDNCKLKEAISKFHSIEAEQIYLGNGAIDALYTLVEALDIKKAKILAPTFVEYERAVLRFGGEVSYFHLIEDDFKFNCDRFINELSFDVDTVILCNPNNPTGDLIEKGDVLKLIAHLASKGVRLILDEAFMDFVDESKYSMMGELNDYDNLFILRSLTKFFAIPGVRIGYFLTGNSSLMAHAETLAVPWRINAFANFATCAVLKDEVYIDKSLKTMDALRTEFYGALQSIDGLTVYQPSANYIFFKTEDVLLDQKLLVEGIMIRDCSNYVTLEKGFYRVAVKNKANNRQLIDAIKQVHT